MKGHASLCVFCEMPLSKRHEHDHFPVPKRNGGRDTFCVCINCHDLKDRTPLASMPELRLALEDVWKNGSAKHRIVLAKLYCMFSDADDAYSAAYGAEVAS